MAATAAAIALLRQAYVFARITRAASDAALADVVFETTPYRELAAHLDALSACETSEVQGFSGQVARSGVASSARVDGIFHANIQAIALIRLIVI